MIGSGSGKEGGVTGNSGEKWTFVTFYGMHSLDFPVTSESFPNFLSNLHVLLLLHQ